MVKGNYLNGSPKVNFKFQGWDLSFKIYDGNFLFNIKTVPIAASCSIAFYAPELVGLLGSLFPFHWEFNIYIYIIQ